MIISQMVKAAAYSNPITATVMLSATTIQIPVAIISSVKKYLSQAKDFVLNTPLGIQLFLFAAIGYYIFDKTSKVGHYVFDMPKATMSLLEAIKVNPQDTEKDKAEKIAQVVINTRYDAQARTDQKEINEEGQKPIQQSAKVGNFEVVKEQLCGPHDGIIAIAQDIAKQPVLNGADLIGNTTKVLVSKLSPKLGEMLPDRTINQGATAEEINHTDNHGQNLLHTIAENSQNASNLDLAAKAVKKGGDLGKQDNDGNTPLVYGLKNKALTQNVEPKQIVKVLTENGKQITEAVAPIAQNEKKAELIGPVIEFAIGENGVIFKRDNAEKLLAPTLENAVKAKNTEVVKALIPTINNLATADQVKAAMPALSKELEVREEALANPCNKNPLEILAVGRGAGIKAADVKDYMNNPTVPTSHKVLTAVAVLPNAQAIINEAIIEKTVSTTSKVIGWAGDFLAEVGKEMGKGLTADSENFTANTAQDDVAPNYYTSPINYLVAPNSSWMLQSVAQNLAIAGEDNTGFNSAQFALEWVKE